ncbi:cytidylyltransferase [Xylaria sp. CBS 124048]|nr:cytidylyltransferase [Xylaria sp. CBS 124048]
MESRDNHEDPSLLLLPPPPHPANHTALTAAYEPPIKAAISQLKNEKGHPSDVGSVLFVGIVSPILTGPSVWQKSLSWPAAQSVLARIYSIVAIVCAQLSIPSDMNAGPGSVDVRVVFIDHDSSKPPAQDCRPALDPNNTVIVDLPTFASTHHPWRRLFRVNSELGHQVCSSYLEIYQHIQTLRPDQITVVDSGLSFIENSQPPAKTETYPVVCLGGTFDHLHPGHKLLLTAAAILLKVPENPSASPARFIIGVTGDELLKRKKHAELVQSWDVRVRNVIEFLASVIELSKAGWRHSDITTEDDKAIARFRGGAIEIHCVVLQDAFGPTITEEAMDVLVVSGETRSGGEAVNTRRRDRGWHDLEIFEVDVLDAEDVQDASTKTSNNFATKISSTAIRERIAQARKEG